MNCSTGGIVVGLDVPARRRCHGDVELWFKAAAEENGALFSMQNSDVTDTPSQWIPMLYVGTDGLPHGKIWTATDSYSQIVSSAQVDDGQWHHVVLSGAVPVELRAEAGQQRRAAFTGASGNTNPRG